MDRMWTEEAYMKYQKQWIVMVNLTDEKEDDGAYKTIGDVYLVTSNKKEAYDKAIALGGTMGENTVVPGFDDTPEIGGLWNL